MKLLTFLSTGYGRMGKNHTRNTTYTRGRLVAHYWLISIFFCYFPQLLYFLIHHHYCRPPERSSLLSLPPLLLDISSADSWTARESWKPNGQKAAEE
jgi:hypothetical protein